MGESWIEYSNVINESIPDYVYESLVSLFIIGITLIMVIAGFKKGWRKMAVWSLLEYIFLVLCLTLFFRLTGEIREIEYNPFRSISQCFQDGVFYFEPEIVLNFLLFIPIGLLLGMGFKQMNWWKVMLLGMGLSGEIEILQFVFKRGFADLGDIINNAIGCITGYALYCIIKFIICRKVKLESNI